MSIKYKKDNVKILRRTPIEEIPPGPIDCGEIKYSKGCREKRADPKRNGICIEFCDFREQKEQMDMK